jgi:hypothetical protein
MPSVWETTVKLRELNARHNNGENINVHLELASFTEDVPIEAVSIYACQRAIDFDRSHANVARPQVVIGSDEFRRMAALVYGRPEYMDKDQHTILTARVYGIRYEQVTAPLRDRVKQAAYVAAYISRDN